MVCPAISYNFGATGGGIICVLQTHFIFLKIHSYQNSFVHNYQVRGHTSFLVSLLLSIIFISILSKAVPTHII